MSDFYEATKVNLNSQILKAPPKTKTYRNYKAFEENRFNEALKSKVGSIDKLDYPLFDSILIDILNRHALKMIKTMQANNHQFLTETLSKILTARSILKNAYLKSQNNKNWEKYKKQKIFDQIYSKKQKINTFVI